MSTRRLFLPAAGGVFPIWLFGGPNNGSIWLLASLPDDTIVILGADQYWKAAPGTYLAYGDGGKAYATSDPVIMPPSAVEAQAMALVVNPAGKVNSSLLGTFLSPNDPSGVLTPIGVVGGVDQYASLPTSMAVISISGVTHLLVAGLFSFYLKAGHAYTADGLAAIDMTTGLLNTGFTGQLITPNASFAGGTMFPPQVFSDGGTNFGICGIGTIGSGPNVGNMLQYLFTFTSGAITSGTGTFLSVQAGAITPPIASYGSTGFNEPFTIGATGAFGTAFPSGRLAICPPCAISAGVFMQDSLVVRPNPDPPTSGSFLGSAEFVTPTSGPTFTVTLLGTSLGPATFFGQGGSTGDSFTLTTSSLAALAAAVAALFPECTLGTVTGTLASAVFHFTVPTGMTYAPFLNFAYAHFSGSGISREDGATFISLESSDGLYNEYIDLNSNGGQGPLSTAIANNGTLTCYAFAWINLQWSIKILGVIRINVAVATQLAPTAMPLFGLTPEAPVSVVSFKNGFAISLPYLPIFGTGSGTPGAPATYKVNPAVASGPTVTLKCPIIVIDAAGVIDTAFDAALWTNFFSLARTDGARFGSMSLAADSSGNLYFGSMYIPNYLDPAIGPVTQSAALGDVTPAPAANPLTAGGTGLMAGTLSGAGDGLEVLCACDTGGAIVLPD